MASFFSALRPEVFVRIDDDSVDRLSRFYTPLVLLLVALIGITVQNRHISPASCLIPQKFEYINSNDDVERICWEKTAFYLPHNLDTAQHAYYQGAPLLLLFQALLAFVPGLPWSLLNCRTGISMPAVMEVAGRSLTPFKVDKEKIEVLGNETRDKELRYIANLIGRSGAGQSLSPLLFIVFMLTKLLYFISAVLQLVLLDYAFGIPGARSVLERLSRWFQSSFLPTEILCDFETQQLDNVNESLIEVKKELIQCTLPLNALYSVIFFILWCWLLMLSLLILFNALLWIIRLLCIRSEHPRELRQQLLAMGVRPGELGELGAFKRQMIQVDGWLAIKLISLNVSEALAAEVLYIVWTEHLRDRGVDIAPSSNRDIEASGAWGARQQSGVEPLLEGVRHRPTVVVNERSDGDETGILLCQMEPQL